MSAGMEQIPRTTEVRSVSHNSNGSSFVLMHRHADVIRAAGAAGLNIIPLAWTLRVGNQTVNDTSIPRVDAVTRVCAAPFLWA